MILTVVEVRGIDDRGQLHVRQFEVEGHVNVARAEFIERMRDEEGLEVHEVRARKVGMVQR